MKKIRGCQAVITAVRVTWRPGCFYVCLVQWVFVLLGLSAAWLLLEALPGDAMGMKQAPSSQAAGSVQWSEQCWLPVGFLPVMEGTEATGAWGWKGEGAGMAVVARREGACWPGQPGNEHPFPKSLTPVDDPIKAGVGGCFWSN